MTDDTQALLKELLSEIFKRLIINSLTSHFCGLLINIVRIQNSASRNLNLFVNHSSFRHLILDLIR